MNESYDVNVRCEVCGSVYAAYPKDYVAEMKERENVRFMCNPCADRRNAAWSENEKRYRTSDGKQKRW